MNKIIIIFMVLSISLVSTSCTKMRATAWYSDYGLQREDLGHKAAVPALTKALKDRNLYVRIYSSKELGIIGPDASDAIPALVEILSDPTPQVRMESAKSLSLIGLSTHPEKLSNVSRLLSDGNSGVRLHAISAIGTLGEVALPVSLELIELTNDEHPAVRREAMNVLNKINYRGLDFIARLEIIATKDSNARNQKAAIEILQGIQKK